MVRFGRKAAAFADALADSPTSHHEFAVAAMNGTERKAWQLAVQMIFQDSYASLNPRLRVSEIAGELPSPLDPPPGCAFHPRCPHAFARCKVERPALF